MGTDDVYDTFSLMGMCKSSVGSEFVLGNIGACDWVVHKTFLWKQKQINWKASRWKQSKDICKVNHKFPERDNIKENGDLESFLI